MGNCCQINEKCNVLSSVNLNELMERTSLINQQLEQLGCCPSQILVKTMTWNKDSYDLFDYENNNRTIQQMVINKGNRFYRDESNGSVRTQCQGSRLLLSVDVQYNCFWVQPKQQKQDHSIWLVVRSIQKHSKQEGVQIHQGDSIRVGKVGMKIKEIHFKKQQKTINSDNNRETLLSTEEERCRICLLSCDNEDDPKIAPCNCSGTISQIHLKCLQHWIATKYNVGCENVIVFLWDIMKCELCKTNFKRKIINNGQEIDLVEISKKQYNSYAIIEMKKSILRQSERFTYILNLDKLDHFKIGRANDNHVRLCDISVSRFHCKLILNNQQFYIVDNNSKFGTLLKLKKKIPLFKELNNIQFQAGRTVFEFENCSQGELDPQLF